MAADYSKACDHERTQRSRLSGHTYCLDCGVNVSLVDAIKFDRANAPAPRPLDTSEPGPIKPDYAAAVSDARVLNWRPIPHAGARPMPLDKPFYAAWRHLPWGRPVGEVHWRVERVAVGQQCPALAQWWADDLLGLPPCND